METKKEWVFFKEIDFDDPKFNVFSVDTRDFHCGYIYEGKNHPDVHVLSNNKNKDNFFHTKDELLNLLDRYFNESGGKKDWRYFCIDGFEDWGLKYIRIWRNNLGFIVCNKDNKALNKEILSRKGKDSLH